MGLHNINFYSDKFDISSEVNKGTFLKMIINTPQLTKIYKGFIMNIGTIAKELNLKVVSALDRIKNNNVKGGYTGNS